MAKSKSPAVKKEKAVPAAGTHRTTPEDRKRGRWLSKLGFKRFFPKLCKGRHWSEMTSS